MRLVKMVIVLLWFCTYCQCSKSCVPCNGSIKLANKRFNEVAYPTAHNAQSYKKSIVQNQDLSIPQQLEAGIRAFKLPIWYDCDDQGHYYACVCHGLSKDMIYSLSEAQILNRIPYLMRSTYKKFFNS